MKKRSERERDLAERIAILERQAEANNAEYGRFCRALEGLMRAVLVEVCSDFAHPTSIACGRLIAAVETASRTVHDRTRE